VDVEVIRCRSQRTGDDPLLTRFDFLQRQAHMGWQFESAAPAERVSFGFLEIAARTTPPFGELLDLLRG
jgi:hypothetical protein